ncbi:RNA polymerase sigma24 factor [Cellulomonas composti]|uniref:RNA polymerase sigma24 factor n=1 Tax=Cellulomonas composti TaxID=266130 RepID=A0A511JDH0_9CELL|nr:RNA polymerase sigma24 factor [Cellulomonas composti]
MLRVCRAALGPGADADDAWSETFLAALRAWPDLDDGVNVEAWLVRVAQRRTIDVLRSRARHPVPTSEVPDSTASRGDPGEHDHDIWREVATLPERQRLAIAYHYLGGLPHTETAELVGGTPEAVRRAASDGLTALRRRMTGEPGGPTR